MNTPNVDNGDVVKCGVKYRRTVTVSPCQLLDKNDKSSCEREYFFYLPKILCDNVGQRNNDDDDDSTMILPMIVAIHCFGCTSGTMWNFGKDISDSFNFVLALPTGEERSWNAQQCCGKAQHRQLNDVGFLQTLIDDMAQPKLLQQTSSSPSPPVVVAHPDLVYGVGWSNGGYMTMYAAALFRAIAPISGYQIDFGFENTSDHFADKPGLQPPPVITKPTPMFLHHAIDDPNVRITGCCTDPSKPKCCCGLSNEEHVETCSTIEEQFEDFGHHVNGCPTPLLAKETILNFKNRVHPKSRQLVLLQQQGMTPQQKNQNPTYQPTEYYYQHHFSNATTSLQIQEPSRKVEETGSGAVVTCQTAQGCEVNTTLCIHSQGHHFNIPFFYAAFPMRNDIGDFFARDACQIALPTTNAVLSDTSTITIGNTWSSHTRSCTCSGHTTTASIDPYCLRERSFKSLFAGPTTGLPENVDGKTVVTPTSTLLASNGTFPFTGSILACMVVVVVLLCYYLQCQRKHHQNGNKGQGRHTMVPNSDAGDDEETLSLRLHDENAALPTGSGTGKIIARSNVTRNATIEMSNL